MKRLPIVGVMGDGNVDFPDLCGPLGRAIAASGCHLLTGAGGGVMSAVAAAFTAVTPRAGLSIGIVRAADVCRHGLRWYDCPDCGPQRMTDGDRTDPRTWRPRVPPNDHVEIAIKTHLPDSGERGKEPTSRNHINVLTADLVVALPGERGTRSEVELALEYRRPLVVFVGSYAIDGLTPHELIHRVPEGTATIANSIEEVVVCLRSLSVL